MKWRVNFRTTLLVLIVPFVLVLTSCNQEMPHLRVIRGNYSVSRGDYQKAIVDYLRAREHEAYEPWIAYNLGNVYHYLGEADAAMEQWNHAQEGAIPDLQFGAAFNRGVYLFEQGRYDDARAQFQFALAVDPSSVAAKENFELSLRRLESSSSLSRDGTQGDSVQGGNASGADSTATRMLDYIRRKEEQRWRANATEEQPSEERDW